MKFNTNNTKLKISAGNPNQFPRDPLPQIAFSGKSNVGKSSLINTLLANKSIARVSSAPGKTITVNFFNIDNKLYFVDLPGYGYAKSSFDSKEVWSDVTDAYFSRNPMFDRIALILQLVDSRHEPTQDDKLMVDYLLQSNIPFVIVATKTDKLTKAQLTENIDKLKNECFGSEIPVIPFSSVTRNGRDTLISMITKYAKL